MRRDKGQGAKDKGPKDRAPKAKVQEVAVSENGPKMPSPFDVGTIKELVELMTRHDLSEVDLREGELRIRLHRGPRGVMTMAAPMPTALSAAPAAAAAPSAAADKPQPG